MNIGIKVAMAVTGLLTLAAGVITGAFVTLVSAVLSVFAVYVLALRRGWNAVLSAVLSIFTFAITSSGLQIACVFISAIVAEEMLIKK